MMMYKCLLKGRRTPNVRALWPVRARVWTPVEEPALCTSGWHLATPEGLSQHLCVGELWEAEGRGRSTGGAGKVAFAEARLLRKVGDVSEQTLRTLACDFAEHVLDFWEAEYPGDLRPRTAIEVARRYARGEATVAGLKEAADAAYAAAAYAHGRGAYGAACAAWDAAAAAYFAAAAAAERRWQGARILEVVG